MSFWRTLWYLADWDVEVFYALISRKICDDVRNRNRKVDSRHICQFFEPCSVNIDLGVSADEPRDALEHHVKNVRGIVIDPMRQEMRLHILSVHSGGVQACRILERLAANG